MLLRGHKMVILGPLDCESRTFLTTGATNVFQGQYIPTVFIGNVGSM